MVETREREQVYVTDSSGPSTLMVVLFSLLIVAVLGFMVYFLSTNGLNNQSTLIERNTTNTETTVPVPVPVPQPSAPSMPDINITPPSTPAPAPATPGSDSSQ